MSAWYRRQPLAPPPRAPYIPVRRIVGLRQALGLRISEMAMRLGISPAAYGKIEVCGRVETAEQLRRLAAVLGVSEAQLRGEGLQGWERPDCRSRQAVALWTR